MKKATADDVLNHMRPLMTTEAGREAMKVYGTRVWLQRRTVGTLTWAFGPWEWDPKPLERRADDERTFQAWRNAKAKVNRRREEYAKRVGLWTWEELRLTREMPPGGGT